METEPPKVKTARGQNDMTPKRHNQVLYDQENDLLYVLLSKHDVARTRAVDDLRVVDYDANDQPVGIEFMGGSDRLDWPKRRHSSRFRTCCGRPRSTSRESPDLCLSRCFLHGLVNHRT